MVLDGGEPAPPAIARAMGERSFVMREGKGRGLESKKGKIGGKKKKGFTR